MPIDAQISDLNPNDVLALETELVEMLSNQFPSLDLSRGKVLRDLLLRPAAVGLALMTKNVDLLRQSMFLSDIEADPDAADSQTVDRLLSNYLITRQSATNTTGLLTVVVSSQTTTIIPFGTTFTDSAGNIFTVTATYTGVTLSSLVISNFDRLMRARSDGRYAFTIPVVAATAGNIFVGKDTRMTMAPPIERVFDIYAEADFTPGRAEETNADLVSRLKQGITVKAMSGRQHIESLLTSAFPQLLDISIIGFGDPEMQRDRHNFMQVSQGGKADLYVRTAELPALVTLEVDAVLHNKDAKYWRINFDRITAAGLYRVESILPLVNAENLLGSLTLISDARGLDLSAADANTFVPYFGDTHEGVFSAYQTAAIVFHDPNATVDDLTENESVAQYRVVVAVAPNINDLQNYVNARDRRPPLADYVVRAAIPCFLGVEMAIQRPGSAQIDVGKIQAAVASLVNAVTFAEGRISAALVMDAAQELLPAQAWLRPPVNLYGTLIHPVDGAQQIHSTTVLTVPEDLPASVSNRTVSFYLRPEHVSIDVQSVFIREA